MTMQEVYASYVEKSGNKFLNEAGNGERVNEIKSNFKIFCEKARVQTETRVAETPEM